MSDNAIIIICATLIQIVILLIVFTDFFDNVFKKKDK